MCTYEMSTGSGSSINWFNYTNVELQTGEPWTQTIDNPIIYSQLSLVSHLLFTVNE